MKLAVLLEDRLMGAGQRQLSSGEIAGCNTKLVTIWFVVPALVVLVIVRLPSHDVSLDGA